MTEKNLTLNDLFPVEKRQIYRRLCGWLARVASSHTLCFKQRDIEPFPFNFKFKRYFLSSIPFYIG